MKRIGKYLLLAALGLTLVGCKTNSQYIIVTSGTTVGFDVSEAPSTASPQATLAYKRVEVAIVPVTTNGVSPDVLMDFRFRTSIFSANGGIYSRLAIGPHATTQIPAAVLMSKDPLGNVSSNISSLIPNIQNALPK